MKNKDTRYFYLEHKIRLLPMLEIISDMLQEGESRDVLIRILQRMHRDNKWLEGKGKENKMMLVFLSAFKPYVEEIVENLESDKGFNEAYSIEERIAFMKSRDYKYREESMKQMISYVEDIWKIKCRQYEQSLPTVKEKALKSSTVKFFFQANLHEGNKCLQEKKYGEAIDAYSKELEIDATCVKAYSGRGLAFYYLRKYERSIRDYDEAIKINPYDERLYNNRGLSCYHAGRKREAIKDYSCAIEIAPNFTIAYNNRGNAYSDLQRYVEACDDYTKAIQIDPKYSSAYYNRGMGFLDLAQFEHAIEDFDIAMKLNPRDINIHNNKGVALSELKKYEEAKLSFDKAININSSFIDAYNNRGEVLIQLGLYEEALIDFDKTLELNKKYVEAYKNKAHVFTKLGKDFLAAECMERYNRLKGSIC